jgi:hypothetical protein
MRKTAWVYSIVTVLTLVVFAAAFAWLFEWASRVDAVGRQDGLPEQLMQRKSSSAREILAGLVSEDFNRAGKGVAELRKVASAAKLYMQDDLYGGAASEFAESLDALDQFVRDRDLAEAKSGYDRMIASCVACHRLLESPSSGVPVDRLPQFSSDAEENQLP